MFEVVESFQAAKSGDESTCEDVIADGVDWIAVADGATDTSGFRFEGRTGGQIAARVAADAVATARTGTSVMTLIGSINDAYNEAFGSALEAMGDQRPSCAIVALDKKAGLIVQVGDVAFSVDGHVHAAPKRIDTIHAQMRAAYTRMLLAQGHSSASLLATDPGREVILPGLAKLGVLRNNLREPDLAFGAVDGTSIPRSLVEILHVDPDATQVVIATDGYPEVLDTLVASEKVLSESLAGDPLRIGTHAGTKALQHGAVSFDDRAYVRLRRR